MVYYDENGLYSLKNSHNPFGKVHISPPPPPPLRQNSGWTAITRGFPHVSWWVVFRKLFSVWNHLFPVLAVTASYCLNWAITPVFADPVIPSLALAINLPPVISYHRTATSAAWWSQQISFDTLQHHRWRLWFIKIGNNVHLQMKTRIIAPTLQKVFLQIAALVSSKDENTLER